MSDGLYALGQAFDHLSNSLSRFSQVLGDRYGEHEKLVFKNQFDTYTGGLLNIGNEFLKNSVLQYNASLDTDNDPGSYYQKLPSYFEQEIRNAWAGVQPNITNERAREAIEDWLGEYIGGQSLEVARLSIGKIHDLARVDYAAQLQSAVDRGDVEGVRYLTSTADPIIIEPAKAKQDQLKALYELRMNELRTQLLAMDPVAGLDWLDNASPEELAWQDFDGNTFTLTENDKTILFNTLKSKIAKQNVELTAAGEESYQKAYTAIKEGDTELLANWQLLKDPGRYPGLSWKQIEGLHKLIEGVNADREGEIEDQKKALFGEIEMAMDYKDFDRAKALLGEAVNSGYFSGSDRNLQILAYRIEQEERADFTERMAVSDEEKAEAEYGRAIAGMELKLIVGDYDAVERDLLEFQKRYQTPEGQTKTAYFREQLEQGRERQRQEQERRERAKKEKAALETTDPQVYGDIVKAFYDPTRGNEEVTRLVKASHGKGLSNDDTRFWLDKVANRQIYATQRYAVDMVTNFYDNVLEYETSETKILELRIEEARLLKQLSDAISTGELTDKGVLEYATNLLANSKQRSVSRAVRNLVVPEPEKREIPPAEAYWQEMTERFTEYSGAPPVETGEIGGQAAFFDGQYWHRYDKRTWHRWDGKSWVTE